MVARGRHLRIRLYFPVHTYKVKVMISTMQDAPQKHNQIQVTIFMEGRIMVNINNNLIFNEHPVPARGVQCCGVDVSPVGQHTYTCIKR